MEIKDWQSCPTQSKLYKELKDLDLLENIAELDVFGFTIIPPEKVASKEFHLKIKRSLIRVVEERFGKLSNDGLSWKDKNQIFRMILWRLISISIMFSFKIIVERRGFHHLIDEIERIIMILVVLDRKNRMIVKTAVKIGENSAPKRRKSVEFIIITNSTPTISIGSFYPTVFHQVS